MNGPMQILFDLHIKDKVFTVGRFHCVFTMAYQLQ